MSRDPVVIVPYIFENEIQELKNKLNFSYIDYICEVDSSRIGPDMMYQKLWKKTDRDIVILHSDMFPLDEDVNNNWYVELINYAKKYPEAGIIGSKLLYPAKADNKFLIQYAGGKFNKHGNPDHFGSGLDLFSNQRAKELEKDLGQYDFVREVAWATFGGIYIRRELLNKVGDFDSSYEWSYNRDVDYCLTARSKGYKIYQTPTALLHFESKDVKRIRTVEMVEKETRNLIRLKNKWQNTEFYKTVDKRI